jgi:ApaG protein
MSEPGVYEADTRGVIVRVKPTYLPDQSDPPKVWVWAYAVQIENRTEWTLQLVSRRWLITDGLGRQERVEGPGVVGEQPVIKPGQSHAYASGCPLPTPSGSMVGSYRMLVEGGDAFDAAIPAFSLDLPGAEKKLN